METFISRQGLLIIFAFALGAILGICYDLIHPLRRRLRGFGKAAADLIFAFLSALMLFTFSMSAGNGRLGLWELTFALMGFLCYLYTISDKVYAFFDGELTLLVSGAKKIVSFLKKAEKSAKKLFKKLTECYIIKKSGDV